MNHLKLLPTKKTNKLFLDKFRYKIVVVSRLSQVFRGRDIEDAAEKIAHWRENKTFPGWVYNGVASDLDRAYNIVKAFQKVSDYKLMVSSPFLTFYTDKFDDFKQVSKELFDYVKYISMPEDANPVLEKNTVYLKRIDYDFKITITQRIPNNESFFKWCTGNDKIRMPRRCRDHVRRGWRSGDSYFYVKDAKTLSMVQMFLGSNIQRIDRVVKKPV
ncbi:hypothetical protein EB118_10105 [bacterium]|nr:hypothetical protein [bacterium]